MRLVIIESPFHHGDPIEKERYLYYARACVLNSLLRGEAPIASHLLYPQVLDDLKSVERDMGINAGLSWLRVASLSAVYTDFGVSKGMHIGVRQAEEAGVEVCYRTLPNHMKNMIKPTT